MRNIDCLSLLESDKPEDIVLAILCKQMNPKKQSDAFWKS